MNNLRRFATCVVLAAVMTVPSIGEQKKSDPCPNDSVYLFGGQIITGIIIEDHPGNSQGAQLKIQTEQNQVRTVPYNRINLIRRCVDLPN